MAELWFTSLDGTLRLPAYQIGPYGTASDLQVTTRWGEGACGMYEVQFSMPLPPDFSHPLLRRGALVEVMEGPYRVGSPSILTEPAVGSGLDDPWQLVATGIGREVEGENSFYCFDASLNATTNAAVATDNAITRPGGVTGWRIAGRDATVPNATFGPAESDTLNTLAALFNSIAGVASSPRWGVDRDNILGFKQDPTTPTYQVVPEAVALGTADDDYATAVYVRYLSSLTSGYETVVAPASASSTETMFGRREYPVDITTMGAMSAASAQAHANGILAKAKGRLAWTNSLTLTSNEILTMGGVPADLSKVLEDVGTGCMVRLNGIWDQLLEFSGKTYLDVIVGEARYVAGAPTIDLAPMGLAKRDLASIVEELTGQGDVAA